MIQPKIVPAQGNLSLSFRSR